MTARARLLKVRDVAEAVNVAAYTVRRWIRAGQLPAQKLRSGHWRVRPEDVEAWLVASDRDGGGVAAPASAAPPTTLTGPV